LTELQHFVNIEKLDIIKLKEYQLNLQK